MHKGEAGALPVLVKKVFEPVMIMYRAMLREGIGSGELIETDWMQMLLATLGANVFYFLSSPMVRLVFGEDPLRLEALASRRKLLLDFLGQALFIDRQRGAEVAARVYADTPMPEIGGERLTWGGKE